MRPLIALLVLLAVPSADTRRREIGNLIVDGVPDVPRRIVDRLNQYLNVRGASLVDWEPGGAGVLIATRFADTAQIHLVAAPGADRRQLTFYREPVGFARFDPKVGSRGFVFGMDAGGGEFYQYYWFDRQTGKHSLLTDGKSRNQGLVMAHTGGKLAFSSTARNRTDFDLYAMSGLEPGSAKLIKETRGQWDPVDWSPDDSKLLVRHDVSINESYLHLLNPISGELKGINPAPGQKIGYGPARCAARGAAVYYASDEGSEFRRLTRYDLKTGAKQVLTPKLDWDVEDIAVSPDGKWLAYAANEGGTSALYLAETARPGEARRIDLPKGVVGGLKFDRQSRRLGWTLNSTQSPSDVYSVDVRTHKLSRWTFSEVGGLNPETFVAPELIQYKTFDGRMIPSWYYRPRGPAAKPAPVALLIHGGPEGQAQATFSSEVQYLAAELGVAVLVPNVRGSSGYGKSYLLLDNGLLREDSVKDIGGLLDWIATRPELDKARVAVLGGSYGGYMVLSSLFHYSDRLRCGIDVVGISNFVSFLEHTESYRRDLRRVEYGDERDPKMRAFLQSISPTTNAAKIKRPLLVAQGRNDPRVPASEAEQIVKIVRRSGGQVWYILATDEGHGYRKKTNSDYLLAASMLFFEQNLLP